MAAQREISNQWIRAFARQINQDPYHLIESAKRSNEDKNFYEHDNTQSYGNAENAKWRAFWRHWEIVTGLKARDAEGCWFSCSC